MHRLNQRVLPAPPERDELPLRPKHAIFDDTHIGLAVYALARPDFDLAPEQFPGGFEAIDAVTDDRCDGDERRTQQQTCDTP